MAITALPALNRTASTFRDDVDTFFGTQLPVFSVETEAARVEINNNLLTTQEQAQLATTQAQLATTQATAAASSALSAGATIWVSGTTYTAGVSKYSPLDGQVYRRMITGAGTTDPSQDAVNWRVVNGLTSELIVLPFNNLPVVRPSINLDFANNQSVDPRITFTRASVATRTNSKGLIEVVASGVPRIDYDAVTGVCKGLLIEESRTNLLTYSEQFDNAAWVKSGATVTPNAVVSPDGAMTADALVPSVVSENHFANNATSSVVAGNTYTATCYFKAGAYTRGRMSLASSTLWTGSVQPASSFNLSGDGSTYSTTASATASIISVGGGWYRCSIIASCVTSGTSGLALWVMSPDGTSPSFAGDGISSLFIWGAQLEVGAFPTSYIPTVASQVTRAADVASMTGSNFSSWYRQDEGSFVAEVNQQSTTTSFTGTVFSVSDGTNQEAIELYRRASDATMRLSVADGGVTQAFLSAGVTTVASLKTSISYKLNSCLITLNGVVPTTDTAATIPAVDQIRLGSIVGAATSFTNGHIRSLSYYPKALTSAELQALSTQ